MSIAEDKKGNGVGAKLMAPLSGFSSCQKGRRGACVEMLVAGGHPAPPPSLPVVSSGVELGLLSHLPPSVGFGLLLPLPFCI